jgi:hypothetical protein
VKVWSIVTFHGGDLAALLLLSILIGSNPAHLETWNTGGYDMDALRIVKVRGWNWTEEHQAWNAIHRHQK